MASAAWELQRAIYAALVADTALTALLGGAHVYDDVPRGAALPYVTLGPSTVRDWSTGSEEGSEHFVSLNVWSRVAGEREVHAIMSAVRDALHEAALAVGGHRLVNLRHESSEAGRQSDGETYRGTVRFRAVLEPSG
jgi:hypothetical protein